MADVSVRPARTGDVAEIARIQIDTWRIAYADLLPAAVRDGLSVEAARAELRVAAPAKAAADTRRAHSNAWLRWRAS